MRIPPVRPALAVDGYNNTRRSVPEHRALVNSESFPTQDEPEGGIGFQHKMSLEQVAC
jgi:hypothetical protein